ncbi:MAG: hypothetical protein ABSA33_06935, partial [Candidatus Micrarchaeaceae archaeon]
TMAARPTKAIVVSQFSPTLKLNRMESGMNQIQIMRLTRPTTTPETRVSSEFACVNSSMSSGLSFYDTQLR